MPINLSSLVVEKSSVDMISDTEVLKRNIGSKKIVLRSVLENSFPEYLSTPKDISLSSRKARKGVRGEFFSNSGQIELEPIVGGDSRVEDVRTGKILRENVSFTSDEVFDKLGVFLHEAMHGRASHLQEEDYEREAKKSGMDKNVVLKFALKGKFLSSQSNLLSEFVANAIPIRDMRAKNINPTKDWEDQAILLDAMERNIDGLSKFLNTMQTPENVAGSKVSNSLLGKK